MRPFGWRTAAKIAWREGRASAFKFAFVILGVAVGVGALTGVRGFSSSFLETLQREARTLMAADLSVRLFALPNTEQQAVIEEYQRRGAALTQITETVSMMSANGGLPVLVSVKAVEPGKYPFYGRVRLEPDQTLETALAPDAVALSDDLPPRLGVGVGGSVRLGGQEYRVTALVRSEPDRVTGSLGIGPRVMVSRAGLERTGLLEFGSRSAQRFLFKLPPQGIAVAEMRDRLKKAIPEALVADYRETHPAITRALDRSTTFLSLVSLIALIVGALGVATAIHSHLQQKLECIAIMKCLGARAGQVIRIYTVQTLALGVAGGLLGILAGAAVQRLFPLLLKKYLPAELNFGWSPAFALEGIAVGVLVTLLFTIPPLLSIRRVRPAAIFRREMAEQHRGRLAAARRWLPSAIAGVFILAGLGGVAGWLAESARMGTIFVIGLAVSLLLLSLVAWGLLAGLRRAQRWLPRGAPVTLKHGMANLYRPGNHAGAVLVALGIGVMFTLTVYLVQKSLLIEVANAAPPTMPNVFLLNVTSRESDAVLAFLKAQEGMKDAPRLVPLVTLRLESADGVTVRGRRVPGFGRRFTQPRSVTWMETPPEDLEVRQGAWWKPGETRLLVAVTEDAAKALNLKPGSKLEWSGSGRNLSTEVVAVFRQKTVNMGGGTEFMFPRAALDGLPVQWLGTARMEPRQVAALQRTAYQQFPTVTVVNVADVLEIVQEVVDQVSALVRFISGFAILAGAIILASAVAGTRFRRMREAAVLKTLGAGKRVLSGIFSVEFLILGSVAGLMGSALATLFSRLLMTRLFDAAFRFDWLPNLASVVLTALVAVGAGWLASIRVLSQKPLEVLRDE